MLCAIAYSDMCALRNLFPKLCNAYPFKGVYLYKIVIHTQFK